MVIMMKFNPDIHHRRSVRLREYDYYSAGAYFVTICVFQRECLFGEVVDGEMLLNDAGNIVQAAWYDLPNHYPYVELDEFVIMPNHFHGVIVIASFDIVEAGLAIAGSVGAGLKPAPTMPEQHVKRHGLPEIVRAFKTFSARRINTLRNNPGCPVWQRNYYEHVIRNEGDLANIRQYIANNPLKWDLDENNPVNAVTQPVNTQKQP